MLQESPAPSLTLRLCSPLMFFSLQLMAVFRESFKDPLKENLPKAVFSGCPRFGF